MQASPQSRGGWQKWRSQVLRHCSPTCILNEWWLPGEVIILSSWWYKRIPIGLPVSGNKPLEDHLERTKTVSWKLLDTSGKTKKAEALDLGEVVSKIWWKSRRRVEPFLRKHFPVTIIVQRKAATVCWLVDYNDPADEPVGRVGLWTEKDIEVS